MRPLSGVDGPDGLVVSVPADLVDRLAALVRTPAELDAGLREVGLVAQGAGRWTTRWVTSPDEISPLDALGEWTPSTSAVLPGWLHPFPGDVLAHVEDGAYRGAVALKPSSPGVLEIAVGTDESARGTGIARRLVATAARELIGRGFAVLYVHALDNVASAKVAEAVGLRDSGWQLLGADGHDPT